VTQDPTSTKRNWYALSTEQTLDTLQVDPYRGLSDAEAAARSQMYGPNALVERGGKKPWRILWEQLTGTLVLILIAAAAVSALIGDFKETQEVLDFCGY